MTIETAGNAGTGDVQPGFDGPFERPFEHDQALFDAAVAEFVAQGYDNASINAILAAAGMSKGQFYYHFGSKEALYFALIEVMIGRKQAFLAARLRPEDLQQHLFDLFHTMMAHSMAFAAAEPAVNAFAESFLRERGKPIYDEALQRYDFRENEGIGRLVELAYRRGELRGDLPLPFVRNLVGYLVTHFADLTASGDLAASEANMHYLIEFMRDGLTATPE